ncbi:hypothetical protein RQP46_004008 [Phenoliferia psychrophenolica]
MKITRALILVVGSVYAATVTLPIQKRATLGESLSEAANAYMARISVGTPPVEFLVLLDTGSSDLVLETAVQTDSCNSENCTVTGPLYNATASSTANVSTTAVSIPYLLGSDDGVIVEDVVAFGSFKSNQTLAATNINHDFSPTGAQTGLLGLGRKAAARTNSTPFVENLWSSGQLDEPLFALSFFSSEDGNIATPNVGALTIGGTNSSQYVGDIKYLDLPAGGPSALGLWGLAVDQVTINGKTLNLSTELAVLDSGTDSIAVPTAVMNRFYASVDGAVFSDELQIWGYPCSSPPNVAFVINGTSYSIAPSDFNRNGLSQGGLFDPPSIGLAPLVRTSGSNSTSTSTGTATGTAPTGTQTSKSFAVRSEIDILTVTAAVVSAFAFASLL